MTVVLSRKSGGSGGGGAPSGPAGGDLSGTYPNPTLGANSVETAAIQDDAVTAAKIDPAAATPIDGWIDDTAATWTRTANQTFTVTGDRTAVFSKGTRLKWTQTTVKYGTVVDSAHSAGTTTVTIATTTDYVLTAAAISANFYSYAGNPQGYPGWFNFTPVYTGFSTDPVLGAGGTIKFAVNGRVCSYAHNPQTNGTSNAAGFTVTLPIAALTITTSVIARPTNNGVSSASPAMVITTAASVTMSVFRDGVATAWTTSGGKNAQFVFVYEI